MPLKQFIERNLFKTIEFLTKNKIIEEDNCNIPFSSLLAFINSERKEFYSTYFAFLCEQSQKYRNSIVFCNCCNSTKIFLRNQSLIKHNKANNIATSVEIFVSPGAKIDPFLIYLKALVTRNIELTLEVIEALPYFWDAYLLLIDLSTTYVELNTPLSSFFYAYLKILKDIDSPISQSIIKNNSITDKNTLACLHYCYGDDKKAMEIFKSIDCSEYFNPSFFEFYGMLLYNSNDPSFSIICENMIFFHKNKYETLAMLGLLKLSQSKYSEARDIFKKAYKMSDSPDLACLIGYSYIKLQEYENASNFYQQASRDNFRILYSIGQGYYSMNRYSIALTYCKKALEIREDGTIYKLIGKIYQGLNNPELAIKYFEHSSRLQEYDSLLYLAEIYKSKNETAKVLQLYEQYLKVGDKNIKTVAEYLSNYYEEQGDFNKMGEYRRLLL